MSHPLLRLKRDMPEPWAITPGHWAVRAGHLRVRCACGASPVLLSSAHVVAADSESLEGVVEPTWDCANCGATFRLRLQSYASRCA